MFPHCPLQVDFLKYFCLFYVLLHSRLNSPNKKEILGTLTNVSHLRLNEIFATCRICEKLLIFVLCDVANYLKKFEKFKGICKFKHTAWNWTLRDPTNSQAWPWRQRIMRRLDVYDILAPASCRERDVVVFVSYNQNWKSTFITWSFML